MTGQVRPEEPVLFSALSGRASVHLPGNPQVAATPGDQEVASISNIALQETRARALEKNAFRQQVAYILARQLQNRPLSAAQTELIWRVHEARTEVLKMLPLGRSNVKADYKACIKQTNLVNGTYRALAARQLKWDIPNGTSKSYIAAALTAVAGSGSCGDHANVAMHVLARDMRPGDRLLKQKTEGVDHSWVRVEVAAPGGGELVAVILDAWADGPVIAPEDGAFTRDLQSISTIETMEAADGKNAHEAFQREKTGKYEKPIADLACQIEQNRRSTKQSQDESLSGANPLDDVVIWGQTPVLSNTFIKKTKRATAYGDSDGRLKNAALEIARAAPGWARYQDSKTLAEKIVSAATSFDKAEKRRLIALPPISLGLVAAAADDTESKQLLSKKSNAGTRPRSGSFS